MNGILLSEYGDVNRADQKQLVLDSQLPLLRSNVEVDPLHHGSVTLNVNRMEPFAKKIFFRIPHQYPYSPSFLVEWFDPQAFTNPYSFGELSEYGVGDFETFTSGGIFGMQFYTTEDEFIMVADNSANGDPYLNQHYEMRYYIFVNPFEVR